MIAGWRCVVCGATLDVSVAFPWRCPNATATDPHHVLQLVASELGDDPEPEDPMAPGDNPMGPGDNPMVRYGPRLAWWAFARSNGMTDAACAALTVEVVPDAHVTPFGRSAALSDAVGADVWVKDETGNIAGSHKARHLVGILLHLRAAETLGMLAERPPLAIASCGNAALAAATLAERVDWPLDVYVPTWMDDGFGSRLERLGARIHRCERRDDDPPGDPAMHRFREARDAGAVPFTVQGPENAACLDAGRTIGWEIADQARAAGVHLDRALIQVGGGAFAACVHAGLGAGVRLDTVQTEGCAPLAAAWERARGVEHPERQWSTIMRTWPDPTSLADGILDDETYDWIADVEAMRASGGRPIVAAEHDVVRAHRLARDAGYHVSATGSAGLAGALTPDAAVRSDESIVVVMSGVDRTIPGP